MAQGPFSRAIQRVGDPLGQLAPEQRAVRFLSPFTVRNVPETETGSTLRGASGSGEVTGYTEIGIDTSLLPGIVTSRIIFGTLPIRINGGASDNLAATNITVSINPATGLAAGTMSPDDFNKLASMTAGAAVSNVTGTAPINVTPVGTVRNVFIDASSGSTAGSMSSANFTKLAGIEALAINALAGPGLTRSGSTFSAVAHPDGSIVVVGTPNGIQVGVLATDAQHGTRGGGTLHANATTSVAGFMSSADKTKLDALATAIYMGANDVAGTTTVRYLNPGYNTGTAGITVVESVVIRPFDVSLLKLIFGLTGAAGATITYQLRKNGIPQTGALIAVASNAAANTVYTSSAFTTVSFAVNDTISVEITKDAGVASGYNRVMLTVRQSFV